MINPLQGLGTEAAQNVSSIFARARSLGTGVRDIAVQVSQALQVAAQRAVTVARNGIYTAYRAGMSLLFGDALGWIWKADLTSDTCAACIAMDGTKHDVSETLDSHINCRCQPEPYYSEDEADDAPTGADWFDQQSADVQSSILGPAKYALYKDNKITLQDVVGTSDNGSIYVKPLKALTSA